MPQETKTVGDGAIEYTATAKWQTNILDYCNNNTVIRSQLKGHVLLNVELDILTSFNLIVALDAASSKDAAYRVSALGRLAYSYLKEV